MAITKPRTLSGFMELLPRRQAQFDRMMELLEKLLDNWQRGYEDITGRPMNDQELHRCREQLRPVVRTLSIRRLIGAITAWTASPHRLMRRTDPQTDGAYACIVKNGLEGLLPFIWIKNGDGLPLRRYSPRIVFRPVEHTSVRAKHGPARNPVRKGKMRVTYSERRGESIDV